MSTNDPKKKRETVLTKAKNEVRYQEESDWCTWCCWCCSCSEKGMFVFDAPAAPAQELPPIMISPGFSHVSIERD